MLKTNHFVIFLFSFLLIYQSNTIASDLSNTTTIGQTIAAKGNNKGALACITCHGVNGEGNPTAGFPRLAGLNADYLIQQIKNFKAGWRQNAVMLPTAKALTDEEADAVSHYYAALDTPAPASANKSADAMGEKLAVKGSWADRNLPACEQCHGVDGYGIGVNFPALAGQNSVYLIQQLKDWQQNKRSGDSNNLMKTVADKLTEEEIKAVASYFESLPFKHVEIEVPHIANNSINTDSKLPEAKPHKSSVSSQGGSTRRT